MLSHEVPLQLVQDTSRILGKVLRSLPIDELVLELEMALDLARKIRDAYPVDYGYGVIPKQMMSLTEIWWQLGGPGEKK